MKKMIIIINFLLIIPFLFALENKPEEKESPKYEAFKAKILRVVDGDTAKAFIYLGLDTYKLDTLRLHQLNTFELRDKDERKKEYANLEKDKLIELVENKDVVIKIYKKGKYGRYIAEIFKDNENINEIMYKYHEELRKKLESETDVNKESKESGENKEVKKDGE